MLTTFAERNHNPNTEMKQALMDIINTLSLMAYGEAKNYYYLSSVDPGVGKSTAIIEWLKAFIYGFPDLEEVGVLLCLDTYDEIKHYIEESKVPSDRFAVYVTKTHENNNLGLGRENTDQARLLITTKDQIKRRSKGNNFDSVSEFYYHGKPRQVRIWDESLFQGRGLQLKRSSLGSLYEILENTRPDLYKKVVKIFDCIGEHNDGDTLQMPELDVSLNEMLSIFYDEKLKSVKHREILETLCLMSGKAVTVRTADVCTILVDCVEDMPNDFTPCLIADASGRVREIYKLHEKERGNLFRLKTAEKKYTNLTYHIWRTSSGRDAYNKKLLILAEEIVKVIQQKPGEEFLIIHHLPRDKYGRDDLKAAILKYLENDTERIHFLHYGLHTATNKFAAVPNVILAGTLFYKVADYEGIGRAEANRPTVKGKFSNDEIDRVRKGESAHHLLQAACRGAIRKSEGDTCPDTNLWIITAPQTGIEDLLPNLFPGSKKTTWKTTAISLTGRRKAAYDFIKFEFDKGVTTIHLKNVLSVEGVNIPDSSLFRREIYNKPDFQEAITELGVVLEGKGKNARFIRPDYSSYFGFIESNDEQ